LLLLHLHFTVYR